MDRKEAIEKVRQMSLPKETMEILEALAPELRESEDERIKEGLIQHLKELRNWKVGTMSPIKVPSHYDAWIAYLEKQKESLHISETCKENASSFTDEDEKIREFLIDYFTSYKIGNVTTKLNGYRIDDILAYLKKQKDLDKMIVVYPEVWDNAINDAYENGKKDGEKQKEQKPVEWSEEDKEMLRDCIDTVDCVLYDNGMDDEIETNPCRNWLKSLPERFNIQSKNEWSEEDEEMYARVIRRYTDYEGVIMRTKEESIANKMLNAMAQEEIWLKSFRPSWKPSEEQNSLKQLKKLM